MGDASVSEYEVPSKIENWRVKMREGVARKGIALGIRETMDVSRGWTREVETSETQAALDFGPTLVLLTHNYGYEVLAAIGGMPEDTQKKFRDVKMVSGAAREKTWLDSFVFPLYNYDLPGKMGVLKRVRRMVSSPQTIDTAEATMRNAVSLRGAGEYLGGGGAVVMCPEGSGEKEASWQKGVVSVLKVAKHRLGINGGNVVMCDVTNVTLGNYLKDRVSTHFPQVSPFSGIMVRYSKPIPFSELDLAQPPETVLSTLETKYRNWVARKG